MKAVGIFVILKQDPEEVKETKGGLILNEKVREDMRYRTGEVISVGEMVDQIKCCDRIMFDRAAGHETDITGETYKVITIRDVVAVL